MIKYSRTLKAIWEAEIANGGPKKPKLPTGMQEFKPRFFGFDSQPWTGSPVAAPMPNNTSGPINKNPFTPSGSKYAVGDVFTINGKDAIVQQVNGRNYVLRQWVDDVVGYQPSSYNETQLDNLQQSQSNALPSNAMPDDDYDGPVDAFDSDIEEDDYV